MSVLYAQMPSAVETDGCLYAVNTDWRVALRMFEALEDEALAALERQAVLLRLFYTNEIPPDTGEALRLAAKFLRCGEEVVNRADEGDAAPSEPQLYHLVQDAPLIYAALRRTYGSGVLEGPMHWFQFAALFADLSADTFFARILYLRRGRMQGTLTHDERRTAAALGHYLDLPHARSGQESEQAQIFFRALREGDTVPGTEETIANNQPKLCGYGKDEV